MTDELWSLMDQYAQVHHGIEADGYDELCYEEMTYEEFVGFIQEALQKGVELPEVVPF